MKVDADQSKKNSGSVMTLLLRITLPVLIIGGGVLLTVHLMNTSPKAKPRNKPVRQTIVQVSDITYSTEKTVIHAMGNVAAAKEIDLKPQVSGEIISMGEAMVPGGYLQKGEQVLKIDSLDYELEILQLESEVAKAVSNLDLEMGNQRIAEKEFEMLGEEASDAEKKLMLRQPQLVNLQASLKAAEAKLKKARVNLARTNIKAPFNAVVQSRSVNLGAMVTSSTVLGQLVDTDSFWVELSLPVEKLQWIALPAADGSREGAKVKIFTQSGNSSDDFRMGRVVRLAADLEEKGRMARIYVEVDDPLSLKPENSHKPILFLGSYVGAEIEGVDIEQVLALKRSQLKDNDTVWLFSKKGTLKVKPVEVLFRGKDTVLIKEGVPETAKLVISSIATPVDGMPLQVEGQQSSQKKGMKKGNGSKKNQSNQAEGGNGE